MRQPRVVDSLVAVAGEKAPEGSGSRTVSVQDEEHKPGWWAVTVQGLLAFWRFFKTPMVCSFFFISVEGWIQCGQ